MVDQETLRKAQLRIIDILKEIDRICQKHDIKWVIDYGTLLGAVRHNGFIPWDDDCDISMMREDYEKFISVVGKELGPEFLWQSRETDPSYPRPIAKVRLKNTKLVEFDEEDNMPYHQGIFVDIYILDYYPSCAKKVLPLFQIMPALRGKRTKYPRGSVMRGVIGVLTAIPYMFHSLGEKIFKLYCKRIRKDPNQPYVGIEIKTTEGVVFRKEEAFPFKREYPFEGEYFPTFNNADACLKIRYGDYMVLPKPEERHIHAKKIEL